VRRGEYARLLSGLEADTVRCGDHPRTTVERPGLRLRLKLSARRRRWLPYPGSPGDKCVDAPCSTRAEYAALRLRLRLRLGLGLRLRLRLRLGLRPRLPLRPGLRARPGRRAEKLTDDDVDANLGERDGDAADRVGASLLPRSAPASSVRRVALAVRGNEAAAVRRSRSGSGEELL
jgi:hypothetical protein